jgi:hypothetical protein
MNIFFQTSEHFLKEKFLTCENYFESINVCFKLMTNFLTMYFILSQILCQLFYLFNNFSLGKEKYFCIAKQNTHALFCLR